MISAEIITIGTEIVLGQIENTNSAHVARALTERGIQVLYQTSVGDDKELLKSVLNIATSRVDMIITTGGLGLTENDITREVVSGVCGLRLVHNKEACMRIQEFMNDQHAYSVDIHNKQAFIPEGAVVITNENGTAIGFALQHNNTEIVCLPGVPREMQSMVKKYLAVYPFHRRVEEGCTRTRSFHTFGIPEARVEEIVKGSLANRTDIKVMTRVHDGIVTVDILTTAPRRADAEKLIYDAEEVILKVLGNAVFGVGDETLEYAVFELLKKHNKTIAVAESCTGGLVSDKLTNMPGVSEYFLEGVVAYSNKAKVDILGVHEELINRYGAVGSQVARAMAEGIKQMSSANIGVGITGIAGPTGATKEKPVGLVYIGVVVDDGVEVKECRFRGSRKDIKKFSANTALNMIRLKLMNMG